MIVDYTPAPKSTDDLKTARPFALAPMPARRPRHRAEPTTDALYRGYSGLPKHRAPRH